jgi:predicted ATP-grasp superfamily ATP-dependent carboligase
VSGRILVTDGEQRAALAVVRSLGRAGFTPLVAETRRPSLAGVSRFAAARFGVPDPLETPDRFAQAVSELSRDLHVDLVLPVTDASVLAVLGIRDRLGRAVVPFPSLAAFQRISDKQAVHLEASRLGLGVPAQCTVSDPASAAALDVGSLAFPLVVKPARSTAETGGRRIKLGVSYAGDGRALRDRLAALPVEAFPVLLQQRIVGPGVGIFGLLWDDRLVASFAHRRLREKPPAGGVSVYCESIAADPALVERSRALLERFGWRGVAMVEYKLDAATGVPYVMEVNGRFWGSLALAVDAGVDFPRLLVELALGRAPAPVRTYRVGVRNRWWWGDVDHLWARWRRTADYLALPPGSPGRWRALWDFLAVKPGTRCSVLRFDDPKPFARETLDWLRGR